jgi:glucose-1-phosphate thymidylyltransferase
MKGIVLAGGTGSRLWPLTKAVSKQLLPVYDKPLIYYPISTLMLAGIRDILLITTPQDSESFKILLGDGSNFGISISYAVQPNPEGIAQAFVIGEDFLGNESCMLILGDNIFLGAGLGMYLKQSLPEFGAHIFTYEVANPSEYGVLEIDSNQRPVSIVEKPRNIISNLAVTGLYYFDNNVSEFAKEVKPSSRGELEITSLIDMYLKRNELTYTALTRGAAWLDTGTPNSLNDAAAYIRIIEERTGLKIACLEEIAWKNNWITSELAIKNSIVSNSPIYTDYLKKVLR